MHHVSFIALATVTAAMGLASHAGAQPGGESPPRPPADGDAPQAPSSERGDAAPSPPDGTRNESPTADPAPGDESEPRRAPAAYPEDEPFGSAPGGEPAPEVDSEPGAVEAGELGGATSEDVGAGPSAPPPLAPAPPTVDPLPDPQGDVEALQQQGFGRPGDGSAAAAPSRAPGIFAEDWWMHSRPAIELHGSFRTRAELFHNFSLGRFDLPSQALWPRPAGNRFTPLGSDELGPRLCTGAETDATNSDSNDPSTLYACDSNTQSGANLRLRLNPEIHISDNLRVRAQVDLFDNMVLGSTPVGYRFAVRGAEGVEAVQRTGYYQLGFYDDTQVPPSESSNSFSDSVRVKRAWGEYTTPIGELRFGRMPHHWGMGMVYHSGDGYDDDYQSTVDRFQFTTGLKALNLLFSASWDFVNEGALDRIDIPGSQPYDMTSLDDVDQYSFTILRQQDEQLQNLSLSRGDVVWNLGLYFIYRSQKLASDQGLPASEGGLAPNANRDAIPNQFARRDAQSFVPDIWFQLKYQKFRFELEAAAVLGSIGSTTTTAENQEDFVRNSTMKLRQFGVAGQLEQKLVEDHLRLRFDFGWASGDPDAYDDSRPGNLIPGPNEIQVNDDTISTFRFHPSYRVDMILNRNILQRVQGTYFLRPSVEYDFIRDPNGQRLGGGVQGIWTRASEFVQTPGHDADLGLELNATLYFQAKDGVLNDTPDTMGGLYAALQYGVLFPLDGMGYQADDALELGSDADVSTAQMFRLYLGILF